MQTGEIIPSDKISYRARIRVVLDLVYFQGKRQGEIQWFGDFSRREMKQVLFLLG